MRLRVVAGGRVGFQPVTEIAAGDERHPPPNSINRRADAIAKAQMIFIGKKAVAERNHASVPTVTLQKIERHGGAVIEIAAYAHHLERSFRRSARNLFQQFFIQLSVHCRCGRAKVCEVSMKLWSVVSDKGIRLERRVR